ncbi:hypothetical protein [Streptomyces sp. NPDC056683]|uniref:hypothetical protein n=1 Tax=Streptomyces sp. NPDC056683 TaxID=3345910 RepID=UPI00369BA994
MHATIEFLPVIVTNVPDTEDQAPLLVDPAAARIVRADQITAGDTVLASFPNWGQKGMVRADYFNDQYEAHPMPYDPTCGCGSCATMADHDGPVVNLGDTNPWDVCDPWAAGDLALIVPAAA